MKRDQVFSIEQAQRGIDSLVSMGYKARLQTLKQPGLAEAIRGFSVSVEMRACDIDMAQGYGYRSVGTYPNGFAWFCGENGYNLTPYPGDSLDTFIEKLTAMALKMHVPSKMSIKQK